MSNSRANWYCSIHDLFDCYLCYGDPRLRYQDELGEYKDPYVELLRKHVEAQREINHLLHWKKEVLKIESEFNSQELGHMLGGKIGESSRAVIMREVPKLLQRCKDLEKEILELRATVRNLGY